MQRLAAVVVASPVLVDFEIPMVDVERIMKVYASHCLPHRIFFF